jgi:hypothetical protein
VTANNVILRLAQGDDFRTFLADFVAASHQLEFSPAVTVL